MIEKFGSDAAQLDTITGGITSSDGTLLIDTDSSTSSAVAFGAATRRLLLSGIENGDFSAGAPDNSTAIDSSNPLPYYTYTQGTNTGISAKWLSSYAYGDGNAIKFEIAANRSDTSLSPAYIERIVPVAATASKRYGIWVNASWGTGSGFAVGGAAGETYLEAQYLQADGTTTGTADVAIGYPFDDIDTQVGVYGTCKPNASYVPTNAVALRIRVGVVQATSPIGIYPISIHLEELQLNIGKDINIFTDLGNPATYGPAFINQNNGVLNISPGGGTISLLATSTTTSGNISSTGGNITATTGNITATAGNITAPNVYATNATWSPYLISEATTSSDLNFRASGSDFTFQDSNVANGTNPRIIFYDKNGTAYGAIKSGAANVIQILNGTNATDYAQLWAERFYPMNGAAQATYIYYDGSRIAIGGGGGFDANGTIFASGAMVSDAISTTTQTASAAIWVLSSGTTYSLRRNSSSRRYKTDIEDADAATLAAARKVRPVHYRSTIEDENGATRLGFIAEEIADAGLEHCVGFDAEGKPETIDATALLAAAFTRINDLEQRLAKLEGDR